MSKIKISSKLKYELWLKAAGRCEFKGCNKLLDISCASKDFCNISNIAHIVADSPKGPRGNESSYKLRNEIDNLMLLCPECHKYIDNEGKDKYDETTLRAMKKHHEDRMRFLTGLPEDTQAHIVTYGTSIGSTRTDFTFPQLTTALLPFYYPADEYTIDLGGKWFHGPDWEKYWDEELSQLEYACKDRVLDKISKWEYKRIALFAFAPMPLLVKLGTLLNNKLDVEVYQKQRRGGWKWQDYDKHVDFVVNKALSNGKNPVLVMSLSFPILDRILEIRPDSEIWHLTIKEPNPDFLTSKAMLYDFGRIVEKLLDEIAKVHPTDSLDVYMSVPVACAVEFGRVWMQKANSSLRIFEYDKRYSNKDKLAITINNTKG